MKDLNPYNRSINEPFGGVKFQSQTMGNLLKRPHNISIPTHVLSIDLAHKKESELEKQEILKKIINYKLSDDVKYFVEEYEKVFTERNVFLWKFLGTLFKDSGITLSTVDKKYVDSTIDIKLVFSILCGVLDDVADVQKDKKLLAKMSEIVINGPNTNEQTKNEKMALITKMWNYLTNELSKLPRYKEFKDIFEYDLKQFLNAFEYSCLVNENPGILNLQERENYDCHNMMVFLFNGIDLMASPEFNKEDLPHLRTAFWHAQKMARIGNWLSTWKRELKQNDIGSGVFTYAISKKILDIADIRKCSENEIIRKIENSDTYEHFFGAWTENYQKLKSLKNEIKSVDMNAYITGLENVIKFHMASEGLK